MKQAKIYLEKENDELDVTTAVSGSEALDHLKNGRFDAVVSDYKMPQMNGLDLLEKIRESDDDVPFILYTGRGKEEVAMKALNLGADRYLHHKGGTPKTRYRVLAENIREVIEENKSRSVSQERQGFIYSLLEDTIWKRLHSMEDLHQATQDSISHGGISKEGREKLDELGEKTRELQELIGNILKLRDVDEERTEEVNIRSSIKSGVAEQKEHLKEKGIDLNFDITDIEVKGGELLKDAISELIENSIERSRGDELGISTFEENGDVHLVVEDDGEGISDELKDNIFERAAGGEDEDMTVGLYMVKEIVECYGGEIQLEDSQKGGARFVMKLKRA